MQLDERIARLIAVGASVTANCQPCISTNMKKALEAGADRGEIAQAIAIGRMVRKGAASHMDSYIAVISDTTASLPAEACDCGL